MSLIEKAQAIAHEAHDSILQKRKYSNEPYWVHTDEVARIVTEVLKQKNGGVLSDSDAEIVQAAHLHDIFEDVTPKNTFYSFDFILKEFGRRVYNLVRELTDVYTKENYPASNRAMRKKEELARIYKISNEGKTIKLADVISNTASIVENDKDFAKVYLREKLDLLPALVGGDSTLLAKASAQLIESYQKLGMTIPQIVAPANRA